MISDINLFHALHYAQPRSTRRLLLQGASKLDCIPSLDKYFPPFVSVNHCYEAVLFCPSKAIVGEVDYVYLLAMAQARCPGQVLKSVSQSFCCAAFGRKMYDTKRKLIHCNINHVSRKNSSGAQSSWNLVLDSNFFLKSKGF